MLVNEYKLNGKWTEFAVNKVSVHGNNSKITLNLKAGDICREREREREGEREREREREKAIIIVCEINVIAPGFY